MKAPVLLALLPLVLTLLVSIWGFATLPRGSRIPIRHGLSGSTRTASRTVGLLLFPLVGVLLAAFELGVGASTKQGVSTVALPMGVILLLLLVFQLLGVTRARRLR